MIDHKHSFLWSFIQPVCIKCPLHVLNVGTVLNVGLQRFLRTETLSLESSQARMKYKYLKAMWYGNHMRVWEKIVLRRQCWSLIGNTGDISLREWRASRGHEGMDTEGHHPKPSTAWSVLSGLDGVTRRRGGERGVTASSRAWGAGSRPSAALGSHRRGAG